MLCKLGWVKLNYIDAFSILTYTCFHPHFRSAVLVLVPLVSALQLNPISNAASGGTVNITWTTQSGDLPTFTLELHNPTLFHNDIAIANTVNASAGSITLALPSLTPR